GAPGLAHIQARMTLESIMQGAKQAMGNSTTAKQLIQAGLAGGALGGYEGYKTGDPMRALEGFGIGAGAGIAPSKYLASEIGKGARHLIGKVDAKTATKVAELLTSNDPAQLDKGLALVARHQRISDALKSLANRLSGTSAVPAGQTARLYV